MATIFSETLKRLRKGSGFQTAYRFYHGNGGAAVLNISYRKYLAIEQGKILPVFGRLGELICALRAAPKDPAGEELICAWLKTMTGEKAYREILEPMLAGKAANSHIPPMNTAMKHVLAGKKYFISPRQMEAISVSRGTYICFLALSSDSGAWTAKNLAPIAGLTPAACEKALEALTAVKVLKKTKPGHYKCPLADKMVEFPQKTAELEAMRNKLLKYQEELIAAGANAYMRRGIMRADADELHNLFPLMRLGMSTALSYAITEKTKKSGLYSVECHIVRLRDF